VHWESVSLPAGFLTLLTRMNHPTTFISYAYDSPEHKRWMRQLADELISRYGVPVLLDQYELEVGHELTYLYELQPLSAA
jgi:hypothetical protein